jgi:ubiquinone biosynthesis protein
MGGTLNILITAFVPVTILAGVLGFALAARRLLGVRFGLVRMVLAGVIALVVAGPIVESFASMFERDEQSLTPLWFVALAVLCALLVAMMFLVVAEALVPTGRLAPITWLRGQRRRMRRSRRYAQILAIVFRHGLGRYLRVGPSSAPAARAELARSLRAALEEGGLTFVKLGQVLSTRRDLVPEEIIEELSALRDQASVLPWSDVDAVLGKAYGVPLEEIFAEFDREPLAAASVAQVHAARLLSGERVVVKVQRPDVLTAVDRDLDIVARLAQTLEQRTSWGRSTGAVDLARGFARAVHEELDFGIEAGNMAAVAGAMTDDSVLVPKPYPALCTARVLVMQRLDGVPLSAAGPVLAARGTAPEEPARALLHAVLRQVLVGGVFHADPHPGNVLLLADGRLGLLDFGSVGRLDAGLREALQRLLLAMDSGHPAAATDAMLDLVARPDEVDEERLERSLGQFMATHLSGGLSPGARMFADLFRLVADYGLAVPPEIAAVFRALATLEGGLREIAPGFDVVAEARGFATSYFAELWHPRAMREAALTELATLLPVVRRLPRRVERIVGAVERGRLSVNVRLLADERDRRHVTHLLHQVLMTVIGAVSGIMAVMLLGTPGGPRVVQDVGLYQLLGYFLMIIAVILTLRVLVIVFRSDRT